tara:strand:+ start:856 stop:1875 length:1020 start_codon:yes stop_codon:yes gene_type:complete
MKIEESVKLDFRDVLIRPKRSTLASRSQVNLERELTFVHSKRKWSGIPIIASNMDTVGTIEMYRELSKHKMITCFHKFIKPEDFPLDMDRNYYMISTGISDKDYARLQQCIKLLDPYFVCVDVANGYSIKLLEFVKKVRNEYPSLTIMAGSIVTRELVEELVINGGVDICRVGIGSGSVCTTRIQTGVGYPQLSAVDECSDAAHGINSHMVSDGGITCAGDVAKAFGAGADFVMCGSMFAGHDESAGDLVEENGNKYKQFYGMSSSEAMKKHYGGVAKYRSAEGKKVRVPYKGPVEETVLSLLGGIRSTLTYVGASRLKDLPKCTTFIKVNRQVNDIYN